MPLEVIINTQQRAKPDAIRIYVGIKNLDALLVWLFFCLQNVLLREVKIALLH